MAGGWETEGQVVVEKVDTFIDTSPDVYVNRTIHALNEKRYAEALEEAKLAFRYGNEEIQYRVLITRVLYEWGRYNRCFDWMLKSGVWVNRDSTKLQSKEKEFIYSCCKECCDRTDSDYPIELQEYYDEKQRIEEEKQKRLEERERKREIEEAKDREFIEKSKAFIEGAVGGVTIVIGFFVALIAISLIGGVIYSIYYNIIQKPREEKAAIIAEAEAEEYAKNHNNWLTDEEMTTIHSMERNFDKSYDGIVIRYYEETYPDGTSANKYPYFEENDFVYITAYEEGITHYISLYSNILTDNQGRQIMNDLAVVHESSEADIDKVVKYLNIVDEYLTNQFLNLEINNEQGGERNTESADSSNVYESKPLQEMPTNVVYYEMSMDYIYSILYTEQYVVYGAEPYEIDTSSSSLWNMYYYYVKINGYQGILTVFIYKEDPSWRWIEWNTTQMNYSTLDNVHEFIQSLYHMEETYSSEKEGVYYLYKYDWEDLIVGSVTVNSNSVTIDFNISDRPVTY